MSYIITNNAFSTLAGAVVPTDSVIAVATGQGDRFPVVVTPDYSYITFEDTAGHIEICKLISRAAASDVLTIVRGQDNTVARSWSSGDIVEGRIIAALLNTAIAHTGATYNAHAASAIAFSPVASIASTNVQAAITELESEAYAAIAGNTVIANAANVNLTAHIGNNTAHTAANIVNVPSGNITTNTVQAALNQLDSLQTLLKANQAQYGVTAGIASDYTLAVGQPITNYVDGQLFVVRFNQANLDNATIQISGLNPPLDIKIPTSKGIRVNVAAGDLIAGHVTLGTVVDGGTALLVESAINAVSRVGLIEKFAMAAAPFGYLACPLIATNISRVTYADLFNAIGTVWGVGDGTTTFGMPFFPANYTDVQGNSNVGTQTVGQVISHLHTLTPQVYSNSAGGIFGSSSAVNGALGQTDPTGGAANLAAGVRLLFCVRYRD